MSMITLPQSISTVHPATTVYEYSLTVVNPTDNDTQDLTAAFSSFPSYQDWQNWLSGWSDTGYLLQSQPQLIQAI